MYHSKFDIAVSTIVKKDGRFHKDAYFFLKDSLEFVVKKLHCDELEEHSHVSGPELLDGIKEYALEEFGSMALAVFESWGVKSGDDIGQMVYHLINEGAFGRSDDDDPSDFNRWMTFEEAFLEPFRPTRPVLVPDTEDNETINPHPGRGNRPATTNEA